ncbi:BspA family leucine-rich repeat surface protein [Epilithonimonas sp.]|uniref:BspA family leucine-rich repeat surface protein n=1 Tax=Epilithonimonas sp. TaxID=2894511 RepID=UPI0028A20E40|nr:BspA family leucine-rich repeat surface protein [Epilithonimonas sp.]
MRKLLLFGFLLIVNTLMNAQRPIITKWNTKINNVNSKEITIYTEGAYTYTYIKADDASVTGSGSGNDGITTIDFPQIGEYVVSIKPAGFFKFNSGNYKLIELSQWGDVNWNTNLQYMFSGCYYLKITATDIPNFSNITSMYYMFNQCSALTSIPGMNSWNTSNVTDMTGMFINCSQFNQNIGNWDVSKVNNMSSMFKGASSFNQHIGNWDTSNVTSMYSMFESASSFNQPVGNWNVSNVTNMSHMFSQSYLFNQPIDSWDVSNVTDMSLMFYLTAFNQPIGNWDVGNVEMMTAMFLLAESFNQPLANWNVEKVKNMSYMFGNTSFNQDLGNWNIKSINTTDSQFGASSLQGIFSNSSMDCQNYMKTFKGWAQNPDTPNDQRLSAQGVRYGTDGQIYRDVLINNKGWFISEDLYSETCNSSLAATDIENRGILLYPNPVKDILNFSEEVSNIKITDLSGKIVTQISANGKSVNFANLAKGVYVISAVTKSGGTVSRKIVKE